MVCVERDQGQGGTLAEMPSLEMPAWLRVHRSHWFSKWRLGKDSCRGRLWTLTAGSSRRAVRESCRILPMVLLSHNHWLSLPALESQSPPATVHTVLKGRKDSTPCHVQQVPRPGFQPWLSLGACTPSLFHPTSMS